MQIRFGQVRLGLVAAAVMVFSAGNAAALSDRYVIDAQYRGMVKKDFPAIGSASLTFTGSGGNVRASGAGRVTNPQDKSKLDIGVDMTFRVQPASVQVTASNNRGNADAQMANAMKKVVPFMYYVRQMPPQASGTQKSVTMNGSPYTLAYSGSGSRIEVALQQGGQQLGKFFLAKSPSTGSLRLERFRVAAQDSVVLNFTSATQSAAFTE